jgi:hypothetical protein
MAGKRKDDRETDITVNVPALRLHPTELGNDEITVW